MKSGLVEYNAGQAGMTVRSRRKNDIDFTELLRLRKETILSSPSPASRQECFPKRSETAKNTPLIRIGTITRQSPTVSDLLIKHPDYGRDCWRIVHSQANRTKPYTRIPSGTEIYLHPETHELIWTESNSTVQPHVAPGKDTLIPDVPSDTAAPFPKENAGFSDRLVNAVKDCIGRPYNEMNCYELVVEGLKKTGIQYRGPGGLAERLIAMAVQKGLPHHAFFSGEGLIEASGSRVYTRSITTVKSPNAETASIVSEMEPLLEKGMVLSFSTTSRGHTGIVSGWDNFWTFINSGRMDHDITPGNNPQGVGEETLRDEICNWLKLAAKLDEPLQITVGRFREKQLAEFFNEPPKNYGPDFPRV